MYCLETLMSHLPCMRASLLRGQSLLEYALIIFLIAAVAILGIVFLVPVIIQGVTGALPAL
jgi:hypothetical protein